MKKLLLISLLFLTGCATTVPVTMKFPAVPDDLAVECSQLDKVKPNEEQLSEFMKVVVTNYGKYHECRAKINAWNEWYKKQKEISDSITK